MGLLPAGEGVIITRMEQRYDATVAAVADQARQYGNHAGRAWYAGVRADHEARVVTVFRVPHAAFDDEVRALLGDTVRVEVADAPRTRQELLVAREMAWSISGPFEVETVSIPDDGGRLRVFVTGSSWEAQAQLDRLIPGVADVIVSRRQVADPAFVLAGQDRRGRPGS